MYTGPNMAQQRAGNPGAKTAIPVIAAICCGATLLFLLAATVVLALIPLYIPQKTLTKASTRSSQVTSLFPLSSGTGRRRQSGSDINNAVGGNVSDQDQIDDIKKKMETVLKDSPDVDGVEDLTADVVSASVSRRRRRLAISKRQTGKTYLRVKYYIRFVAKITSTAKQESAGASIKNVLQSSPKVTAVFIFANLVVVLNGERVGFSCKADGPPIVSSIGAGGSAAPPPDAGLPGVSISVTTAATVSTSGAPASSASTSAAGASTTAPITSAVGG